MKRPACKLRPLVRHDRLIEEDIHDPCRPRKNAGAPAVCPECRAIFHEGRWCWGDAPPDANEETCPACHRERDNFPAGFLRLGGRYFVTHRDEIIHLIRRIEARERQEHPLKRIIGIQEEDGTAVVTTTDILLARGLGQAIQRCFQGSLSMHYKPSENYVRVSWLH